MTATVSRLPGELESKAAAELRARLENGEPIKSDGLESDEETDSGIGSSSGFLMKGSAEPVEAQAALEALQQKHARTLAELEEVSSLYQTALQDITKLAAELEESRLERSEHVDSVLDSPSSTIRTGTGDELPSDPLDSPRCKNGTRRRGSGAREHSSTTQITAVSPGKGFHGGRGHTNQAQLRQVAAYQAPVIPLTIASLPRQAVIACAGALIIGVIAFVLGRFW